MGKILHAAVLAALLVAQSAQAQVQGPVIGSRPDAGAPVLVPDNSSHSFYRSSDGSRVHGPTREASAAYGAVTADCRDGTHSFSHHHAGTCSGHGGVADWR